MRFSPSPTAARVLRLALLALFVLMACNLPGVSGDDEPAPAPDNPPEQSDPGQETVPDPVDQADETDPVEPPPPPAGGDSGIPRYELEPCDIDYQAEFDINVDCGVLITWENHDLASGNLVQLPFAIVYSNSDNPAPDPLVYLSGGPGENGIDVESWLALPFLGERDMVLYDQRGTGLAQPSLNCIEFDFDDSENPDADCLNRLLSEGIDLSLYNSKQSAADVADLMRTLGYDSYNLIGISYGTRLALTIMRDHPEGVRSVILDSVYPPHVDGYAEEPVSAWNAFQELFATCAADFDCNDYYPDLESVFLDTIAYLEQNPADGDLYGTDFVNILIQAMYDAYQIPFVPLVIYDTYDGFYDTLYDLEAGDLSYARLGQDDVIDTDSEGLYNSVQCHEEAPFVNRDNLDSFSSAIPEPARGVMVQSTLWGLDTCLLWAAGTADAIENAAVQSGIPTLLLAGQFDPVTPPRWAQSAAEFLSTSYVFVLPGIGHSVVDSAICAQDISLEFLRNPNAAPNAGCIGGMGPVDFYYP